MISTHISLKTSKILQCSSNPSHVAWERTSDLEQQSAWLMFSKTVVLSSLEKDHSG